MSDHSPEEKPSIETTQPMLWDQVAKLTPPTQKELFEKLISQSQFYLNLTKRLEKRVIDTPTTTHEWDLLQALFGDLSLSNQPSSTELSSLLGLPSIEEIKNQAELFSKMALEITQLQISQQKQAKFFKKLNRSASKQFNAKKIEGLDTKALYSLWTECGEQAFSELSQSDQYIQAQVELLNTLTSIDSLQKNIAHSTFKKMGIASHEELKNIYRSIHILKREFRQKSRQQAQEITTLKRELSSLKKSLASSNQNR